jgi:hypothetical protein
MAKSKKDIQVIRGGKGKLNGTVSTRKPTVPKPAKTAKKVEGRPLSATKVARMTSVMGSRPRVLAPNVTQKFTNYISRGVELLGCSEPEFLEMVKAGRLSKPARAQLKRLEKEFEEVRKKHNDVATALDTARNDYYQVMNFTGVPVDTNDANRTFDKIDRLHKEIPVLEEKINDLRSKYAQKREDIYAAEAPLRYLGLCMDEARFTGKLEKPSISCGCSFALDGSR